MLPIRNPWLTTVQPDGAQLLERAIRLTGVSNQVDVFELDYLCQLCGYSDPQFLLGFGEFFDCEVEIFDRMGG